MIPKIIHYCWLSNDPIPSNIQHYMDSWKKYLPDYEFIHWNFDKFDKSSSRWVSEAFDNKKYAFAADYIRLYALYHYGGIYLDMDVEVLKSFNPFLSLSNDDGVAVW
jgi:Mannosyltransferase OCH1 and related enzymes